MHIRITAADNLCDGEDKTMPAKKVLMEDLAQQGFYKHSVDGEVTWSGTPWYVAGSLFLCHFFFDYSPGR